MLLTILLLLISLTHGVDLCDDPLGANCNPITTYNFANQDSVTIDQPVAANTIVSGVTYDVVIQWTHQVGEVISFSWEIYPDIKRQRFDCDNSRMWFDGIIVDATNSLRGTKGDEPFCVFNMQNGILTNAYLQNPSQTVYFLLNDIMDDGDTYYIDKNFNSPIFPSDTFDPNIIVDSDIICDDPSGTQCNPFDNFDFSTPIVTIGYPQPANTDVVGGIGIFDVVVQWKPDAGAIIDHSWTIKPQRKSNPFDCTNSRLWLNGTIALAADGIDVSDGFQFCMFDIHNGLLNQTYIDTPGTTVFFLFSQINNVGQEIYISRDYTIPIIAAEDYDPVGSNPSIVCDDDSELTCNVITTYSFLGQVNSISFEFLETAQPTLVQTIGYDMVVKWIDDVEKTLDYTWQITGASTNHAIDCSTTKIWINGTIYDAIQDFTLLGDDLCYFNISNGILPQSIIDDPTNKVFFLLDRPIIANSRDLIIQEDTSRPVYSIENYDPVASNPSIVCDDPDGPFCNVISTVAFDTEIVTLDYVIQDLTTVDSVDYDYVLKWNGPVDEVITYSFEIYPSNNLHLTTCDNFKVWYNGTIVGSTLYFRGAANDEPYCVVDMQNGVLNDAILNNPENNIFLLFGSETINNNREFYITKNTDLPVISRENMIFYLYDRIATTIATDNALGTTFTVTVEELTYPTFPEFGGIGNCNTMETVMSSILVAGCSLNIDTSDNINGIYTYFLPKELYYTCSYTSQLNGNNIEFSSELLFDEGTMACKYFRPEVSSQILLIEVPETSMNGITPIPRQATEYRLLATFIELCDPELFPLPQIISMFELNITFDGDFIELSETPYLDSEDNIMEIVNKTCTITPTSSLKNYCIYNLRSTICRSIIPSQGGGCTVDRYFTHTIYNMVVREIADAGTGTSFIDDYGPVPTPIGITTFIGEICTMVDDFSESSVNDQYTSVVKVRNRPNPDWDNTPLFVSFFEPIILEVSLENGGNGTATQLEISNIELIVKDDATGAIINKYHFNRGNKLALLGYSWSPYAKDVHFCSSSCGQFYDDNANYTTPYITSVLIPQLFDLCQLSGDISSKDYFSFSPNVWLEGLNYPVLSLEINTLAILKQCNNDRRLLQDDYEEKHITSGTQFKVYSPVNRNIPNVVVIGDRGEALASTKDIATWMYVSIILMFVLLSTVLFFNLRSTSYFSIRVVSDTIDF